DMRKFIVGLCLMFLGMSNTVAQRLPESKSLSDARVCLQPWLDGLDFIVKRYPTNPDLKSYQEILANSALGEPAISNGQRAVRYLSAPPNRQKGWVGVVPICSEIGLPSVWRNHF